MSVTRVVDPVVDQAPVVDHLRHYVSILRFSAIKYFILCWIHVVGTNTNPLITYRLGRDNR